MLLPKSSITLTILTCIGVVCNADVSHLGRISATRLSRVEQAASDGSPYPAAGFRPQQEFRLPTFQQLREQQNLQQRQRHRTRFQQQQLQPNLKYGAPSQQEQQLNLKYGAPKEELRQGAFQQQHLFPQQPGFTYTVPSFQQPQPQPQPDFRYSQPSQFGNNVPQRPPSQNEDAEYFDENEIERFKPRDNLKLRQSSRLTDNRRESTENEDDEDEDDTKESTTESLSPSFGRRKPPQVPASAPAPAPVPVPSPTPAPPSFATFFPQSASGFVQPTLTYVQPAAAAPNVFAKIQLQPASVYNLQQPLLAQQPLIQSVAQPYLIGTSAQYQSW